MTLGTVPPEAGKMNHHEKDLELNGEYPPNTAYPIDDGDAIRGETFETGTGMRAKLMRLAGKLGVEQRGIERVPEDERHDTSILNIGTMVGFNRCMRSRSASRN